MLYEEEEVNSEPSQSSCPYELLEVMECATKRLDLLWKRAKNPPAQVSLPFLPDLYTEVEKERNKPFLSRIHRFQHTSYAYIEGMCENGYERMPPIEEMLASYLSVGETSSLKAPSMPSKPLQHTSSLNGRAYAAAGAHDGGELRRTMDLALRATKQAATAMGRSMVDIVVTERHLWVNLTRSEPEQQRGPGSSRSDDRIWAQKASVAARAPPPPVGARWHEPKGGRQGSSPFEAELSNLIFMTTSLDKSATCCRPMFFVTLVGAGTLLPSL
ncbi:putative 25.0 kDa protein [Labeo rohita]|uniref:25.0 kDa protein n=1 Tax=Labeo rohita TaxID=84645 RepID=A0ABQ8M6Q7_LABRO|nr:putative 25.0 kDa protein [Labeo rohita]